MKILKILLLFILISSNFTINAQILSLRNVGGIYKNEISKSVMSAYFNIDRRIELTIVEPIAERIIKPDKIGPGRTSNEKIYEFVLPPNEWVETRLLIKVNQEVLIHHFSSSEAVSVRLAGTSFPTLQKPGTIIPAYTSSNCSRDPGVKAKVRYFCVQMNQSERVKLFARNSVRVAIAVKNR